ncbi:MAG: hypothetical protein RBG13Loki_1089 [Promethearchaeota archaeon CR_4]|nr:MAG: hypothetical protein RBG13Loki_1089 [Candidatus Lokiarchaeota archaeon CR_4]
MIDPEHSRIRAGLKKLSRVHFIQLRFLGCNWGAFKSKEIGEEGLELTHTSIYFIIVIIIAKGLLLILLFH